MITPREFPDPAPPPQDFTEEDIPAAPIDLFHRWMADVEALQHPEPTAMTLATCSSSGRPSARIVLLKGADERGFRFFTNYESRKGLELDGNPFAALVFHWHFLGRQVRVEGAVRRLSAEESDEYYLSRPEGSRVGAWASPQSQVIPDRAFLQERVDELTRRNAQKPLKRPPHWGGYIVEPDIVEFWCARDFRLHDRFRFRKNVGGGWRRERLAP